MSSPSAMSKGTISANHADMCGKWFWATLSGGGFELTKDHQNFHFSGRLGGEGPDMKLEFVPREDGSLEASGDSSVRISVNAEQLLLERRRKDGNWSGKALGGRTSRAAAKLYFMCCASRVVPGSYRSELLRFKQRPLFARGADAVEAEASRSSCSSDPLSYASSVASMDRQVQRGSSFSDSVLSLPARMRRSCGKAHGDSLRRQSVRGETQVSAGSSSRQIHLFPSQHSAGAVETVVLPTIRAPFSLVHDSVFPESIERGNM